MLLAVAEDAGAKPLVRLKAAKTLADLLKPPVADSSGKRTKQTAPEQDSDAVKKALDAVKMMGSTRTRTANGNSCGSSPVQTRGLGE